MLNNYFKPTAKKYLIAGTVLKAMCLAFASTAAAIERPWLAATTLVVGAGIDELLKFLPPEKQPENSVKD